MLELQDRQHRAMFSLVLISAQLMMCSQLKEAAFAGGRAEQYPTVNAMRISRANFYFKFLRDVPTVHAGTVAILSRSSI